MGEMYMDEKYIKRCGMALTALVLLGICGGVAACLLQKEKTLVREVFLRIHIVSRAGGIDSSHIFWNVMKKSIRVAALFAAAALSKPLYLLGCSALVLEGYSLGYTFCALVQAAKGAWLLGSCIFLPQNLLLFCVYVFMGLLTAWHGLSAKSTSRYTLLMLASLFVCIPLSLLHGAFTLKLMKLLPIA